MLRVALLALSLSSSASLCTARPPPPPGRDASGVQRATSSPSSTSHEYREPHAARKLKGRFLHITDIHPDPFYKIHSSTGEESACHRGKGAAGIYGAETSGCDSPLSLLNHTFTWIKENLRDEIDFVIWTGDSARHDNDEDIPRSEKQVVAQNELLVSKFLEVFGKPDSGHDDDDDPTNDFVLPIVPTIGNNDILPHNILTKGPNRWTRRYLDVWRQFIPEEQRHQFQRGGWFYTEVIPGRLAVFSLNTMYFYDSNSAVDGCASKHEPGFEQYEWLRIQLNIMRARGMKAYLTGHVPPARVESKMSWDETCWQKYTLWMRQYRDVVVGSFYGHMNIDHFMLQDFHDIKKHVAKGQGYMRPGKVESHTHDISIASAGDYLVGLRDNFARIPDVLVSGKKKGIDEIGGEYGERYSLSFVGASIVPNYFPTLRVFSYNITGLEDTALPLTASPSGLGPSHHWDLRSVNGEDASRVEDGLLSNDEIDASKKKNKKKKKKHPPKNRHKFRVPDPPSATAPPGPAYSPQSFSLLGYTQYFANLTYINNDFHADEDDADSNANTPSTFGRHHTGQTVLQPGSERAVDASSWKPGKHHGKKPKHDKPRPKKFAFHVEYSTSADDVYGLEDLSIRSYLDLAARIAKSRKGGKRSLSLADDANRADVAEGQDAGRETVSTGKTSKKNEHDKQRNRAWFAFVRRAFVGTMDVGDIEDQFGQGGRFVD